MACARADSKPNYRFFRDLRANRRRALALGQVFSLRKVRPTASRVQPRPIYVISSKDGPLTSFLGSRSVFSFRDVKSEIDYSTVNAPDRWRGGRR